MAELVTATATRRLTREQIAAAVGDNPRAIKLIEALVADVGSALPDYVATALDEARQSGSFYSRQHAQISAAAGSIPASVTTIVTNCRSEAFDEGGARYSRMSQEDVDALGLSADVLDMVSFPDGLGGRWMLDEARPNVAVTGCVKQPLGQPPVTDEAHDCTPYFAALRDYLSAVKRGGVMTYGEGNYYLHTPLELDTYVGISGPETQGRDPRALDDLDAVGGIDYMPGLVLGDGVSVMIDDNFTTSFLCLKRAGIKVHTDLAGALDQQGAFEGVGLARKQGGSSRNVTIGRLALYGFAIGFDAYKMHGLRYEDCYGDCLTLIVVRDSGEMVVGGPTKRKPVLTNNDAIQSQSLTVTSLFDSGGSVGLVLAEDVSAAGLITGERVGTQRLPDEFVNVRQTVQVLSANSIAFPGEPWDVAYATYVLTNKSAVTFQPGCATGVAAFYDAGGTVGVQTIIDMPFQPGHKALLGCGEISSRGFWNVLSRISARDFVLEAPWDAALLSYPLEDAELAAMPNNRRHHSVVPYWGTDEGFGIALVNCDGSRIECGTKGGSGIYVGGGAAHISGGNEGGSIGELDLNDPYTRGIVLTQPRTRFTGDFKSTGIAAEVSMERAKDRAYGYGLQLTDNGLASLKVGTGGIVASGVRTKGPGRMILNGCDAVDILEGDFTPASITSGSAADKRRVSLRWRDAEDVHQIATTWQWWAWDADGNAVLSAVMDSSGLVSSPRVFTVSSGALSLAYPTHHGADIELTGTGSGISLDANTVPDGFTFTVRDHRATDWTIPTSWGTGVIAEYALQAAHTKLKRFGWATFVVRIIGGARYVLIRGDTA